MYYDLDEMDITNEDLEDELNEIFDEAKAETFEEKRKALIDYGLIEEGDVFEDEYDMLYKAKEELDECDWFLQKMWDAQRENREERRREERLYGGSSLYDYHEEW